MQGTNMSIATFCEIQGCDSFNTVALKKWATNKGEKTYDEWHALTSAEFTVGDHRFQTAPEEPAAQELEGTLENVTTTEASAPAENTGGDDDKASEKKTTRNSRK